MKLWLKIMGISIVSLLVIILIVIGLGFKYQNMDFIFIAGLGLLPLSVILSIIFMFKYKNNILRNAFLLGMPFILILIFIFEISGLRTVIIYITILFLIYFVTVNLVVHFLRYDLNLIIAIFLLIIGLYFKRLHLAGGGIILTLASIIIATFLILIAVKAFKIKNNRYLSILMFSCSTILAFMFIAFLLKMQHMPGGGVLLIISVPLFIIATLIILLTLPGSNFIEWTRQQKKILLRGLLIPWLFLLYILASTTLIPPYNTFKPFFFLESQDTEVYFNMKDYEIENRNRLE